jgi:hypothetical protein
MVTIPYRAFRRCISRRIVAVSFAPVQPRGWPERWPAVHVGALRIDADLPQNGQRLYGERFVQLDDFDVAQVEAR